MRFQRLHRGDEVDLLDQHHQVDGVEVSLAGETSPEIDAGIRGRQVLAAGRTEKHESPLSLLVRPVETDQQVGYRDLVSQAIQELPREVFSHDEALSRQLEFR